MGMHGRPMQSLNQISDIHRDGDDSASGTVMEHSHVSRHKTVPPTYLPAATHFIGFYAVHSDFFPKQTSYSEH